MITLLKRSSLQNIKYKFLLIYLLNVSDIICTILLLKTGLFIEANPLMFKVIQDQSAALALKVFLPALLLLALTVRIHKATEYQLRISNYLVNIILLLYTLINLSHIIWFVLVQCV